MQNQKDQHQSLFDHLQSLLNEGNAHATLDAAVDNISFDVLGQKPGKVPYTIFQLAEHIRIAQWDILEFSRNEQHVSPKWPDGYWPSETQPKDKADWESCIRQIKSDRKEFISLLENNKENLYKPFPYGDGQTLLKEALVLADHNSYHTGEIIVLRKLLDDWKK
ncbi:MAG TPA: DinB family protein [Hanamia sp.]|nr:DinB family protein [Hanamia sp.]